MEQIKTIFLVILKIISVIVKIALIVLSILFTTIFFLMGSKQVVNFFPKNSKR